MGFCLILIIIFLFSACVSTSNESNIIKSPSNVRAYQTPIKKINLGLLSTVIGHWQVQDWQLQKNGEWEEQAGAKWSFYAIHGGTAIRDEWESNINEAQKSPGFGSQLRVFNPWNKTWSAAWLSSRTRSLEFYTGTESNSELSFISQANQKGRLTKVVFSDIELNSFNWEMQWSSNLGETWTTVYKLQATRIEK